MDEKLTEKLSSLEARVEHIAAQVEALSTKVDGLTAKADRSRAGTVMNGASARGDEFPDASEALLSWVGRSSLLQRLSTVCFLLVVALVLRTVTDNGIINRQLGSIIGMSYAAALMFMGWCRYRRANPLAPVFTVCGTVLMFTIIGEAHAHFEPFPPSRLYPPDADRSRDRRHQLCPSGASPGCRGQPRHVHRGGGNRLSDPLFPLPGDRPPHGQPAGLFYRPGASIFLASVDTAAGDPFYDHTCGVSNWG